MTRARAILYAEDTLGVHSVYQEIVDAEKQLDEARDRQGKIKTEKRLADEQLETIEMDLVAAEWSKHPEMAQSRMDKHVKLIIHQDTSHRDLRMHVIDLDQALDQVDSEVRQIEIEIRTRTARMEQLGGYLNYLAAVKNAATTQLSNPSQPSNPTQPTEGKQ